MISVLFPAYNEEANVAELHRQLIAVCNGLHEPYEIIAIDNASTDKTAAVLQTLSPLTVVTFAYNIGQTAALDAGIKQAQGDIVVILDGDLQNDPADIPRLLEKMREGYDGVVGWRQDRHDSMGRKIFSRFANWLTRRIAGLDLHDYGCALRAFRSELLRNIHLYGVMHVFIPVILADRGARITEIPVQHHERRAGISKYNFSKMATDLADLLTIKFLYSYALRPLVFFGTWALGSFAVASIAVIASMIIKWQGIYGFSQTPLPVIAALFCILSFLLLMLGFVVELLIRIYFESRGQTPYHIKSVATH